MKCSPANDRLDSVGYRLNKYLYGKYCATGLENRPTSLAAFAASFDADILYFTPCLVVLIVGASSLQEPDSSR